MRSRPLPGYANDFVFLPVARALLMLAAVLAAVPAGRAAETAAGAQTPAGADQDPRAAQDALGSVAEGICAEVDWSRPELAAVAAVRTERGAYHASVELVHRLRGRETPRLIYSRDYVDLIRARASAQQRADARDRLHRALERPLVVKDYHGNAISAVGPDVLFLAADESLCREIGSAVLKSRGDWAKGSWGVTRSVCELITWLCVLPDCPDEALVPLLGWLLEQSRAEWAWARTWDEKLLGNSGHNWWLHTFLGFYQAGLFFPEFKRFEPFRAFAPTYFEREMQVLMERDGYTRERSSGYHEGTVDHWLHLLRLAAANDVKLSPEFHQRLRLVAETEWKTLAPNGDIPHLGDTRPRHRADPSLEKLRRVAALFEMPEAKYVAEAIAPGWMPPYEGLLPDGGRNVLAEYERLAARPPAAPTADTAGPAAVGLLLHAAGLDAALRLGVHRGRAAGLARPEPRSHAHLQLRALQPRPAGPDRQRQRPLRQQP